jgi:hypothetical protein
VNDIPVVGASFRRGLRNGLLICLPMWALVGAVLWWVTR